MAEFLKTVIGKLFEKQLHSFHVENRSFSVGFCSSSVTLRNVTFPDN